MFLSVYHIEEVELEICVLILLFLSLFNLFIVFHYLRYYIVNIFDPKLESHCMAESFGLPYVTGTSHSILT